MRLVIRLPSAVNCSPVSTAEVRGCWTCASIRCTRSIMVPANTTKADLFFLKSILGRIRLINQLRGMVTSCNTPPRVLILRAMMNSPESLSARSHSTIRSTRNGIERTSLREQVRSGARIVTHPAVRTVDTMNQRLTNRALWRIKMRRYHVRRNPPPHETGTAATAVSTRTSASEEQSTGLLFY